MSDLISATTDASFDADVLTASSTLPILVDFWAPWCAPCKAIAPLLEEVAKEFAGKIKIIKLDVNDHPNTGPKFGLRGIPTLILFKDGERQATQIGVESKAALVNFINENL